MEVINSVTVGSTTITLPEIANGQTYYIRNHGTMFSIDGSHTFSRRMGIVKAMIKVGNDDVSWM